LVIRDWGRILPQTLAPDPCSLPQGPGTVAPSSSVAVPAAQKGRQPLLMQREYNGSGARRKSRRGEGASSHKPQTVGQSQLANRYPLTTVRPSPIAVRDF
jgi:hypothetical protein